MPTQNEHSTAILIFALSEKEELKRKKIPRGDVLFRALTEHTLTTVHKSGLPYFHLTENEQVGDSFAERFTNAIQLVYEKGFDQLIAIGNDSPHLKTSHIKKAAASISKGNVVLGPSVDGGFYLLGMHKRDFQPNTFKNLPWQTSRLIRAFKSLLGSNKQGVLQLNPLIDIDDAQALRFMVKCPSLRPTKILRLIRSLFESPIKVYKIIISSSGQFQSSVYQNRGSPHFGFA